MAPRLSFGDFIADRTGYRVFRHGRPLDLTPKLLDLLFHFLDRPAQLITREQLLDAVWPDANVTDNALAQAISELREALGDSASSPAYIMTVARRGYRFIAAVEAVRDGTPGAATPEDSLADVDSAAEHTPIAADHAPVRPTPGAAIAVLDFDNVTGGSAVAWLAAGIAETVTSDLAALDHFRVVDRWRVVQAARRMGGGLRETAAALGVPLVVTGSYQQSGARLRITARVVDLERDAAIADAKVDGPASDIFTLQDEIVPALASALRLPAGDAGRRARPRARETSSLEAYRAYTEGWLKIESLDTSLTAAAIADFERGIALDADYALAYAGLAAAELTAFEMTRLLPQANTRALASGIEHARHAIRLDNRLADAHATLSFLLVSAGRIAEGREAARRAVALEPDNWRHLYRLGHALWGGERLAALERALAIYPDFAYARLEMAMVHVARGQFELAEAIARDGIGVQDRQGRTGGRFPAVGFHWLLGALLASRGDHEAAVREFDLELDGFAPHRLYGPEYAAAAWLGRGQALLSLDRPDAAAAAFRRALEHVPGLGGASLGLAMAADRLGDAAAAAAARADLSEATTARKQTQRSIGATQLEACTAARDGDASRALTCLTDLIAAEPPSFVGWTVPIDPCFETLRDDARFGALLARLADRAA